MDTPHRIYRVTLAGSAVNMLLLLLKFAGGILGHSAAMIADAVHSLSDFVTDVIVLVFVKISSRPVDKSHDYGHGKYETLATAIIGAMLLVVALGILWNGILSIVKVFGGEPLERPGIIALVAALVSLAAKELVFRYTLKVGKETKSQAVTANAWHHRSDALTSIASALGIGGAILLGEKWRILDPIASIVVSVFIIKTAVELLVPAMSELMEASLPEEVEDEIEKVLLSYPDAADPHNLRTRKIGSSYAVDVHVRMDGDMTVRESHEITRDMERRIREILGARCYITIHVEPIQSK